MPSVKTASSSPIFPSFSIFPLDHCLSIYFILTERVQMGWFPQLHSMDAVEMETFRLRQKSEDSWHCHWMHLRRS